MRRAISSVGVGALAFALVFVASYLSHLAFDSNFFAAIWAGYILAPLITGFISAEKFGLTMLMLAIAMSLMLASLNLLAELLRIPVDLSGVYGASIVFVLSLPTSILAAFLVGAVGSKIYEHVSDAA